jgi:hypothetical protein
VHDFIDEKSIGDTEGVLLMDVGKKFFFFEGSERSIGVIADHVVLSVRIVDAGFRNVHRTITTLL